jgi:hypothetical protein
MQIKIIIEHKYYSSYQKKICNYREKRREGVLVSIFTDQERNTKFQEPTLPEIRLIATDLQTDYFCR